MSPNERLVWTIAFTLASATLIAVAMMLAVIAIREIVVRMLAPIG